MKQKEFLNLPTSEKDLVTRIVEGIEAKEPYFELFHIAYADLVTNCFAAEKEKRMQQPVYQLLNALLESYRENPLAYSSNR